MGFIESKFSLNEIKYLFEVNELYYFGYRSFNKKFSIEFKNKKILIYNKKIKKYILIKNNVIKY